jgi:hypothetical protein
MSEKQADDLIRRALEARESCLDDEAIANYLTESLEAERMTASKSHLAECPRCEARARLFSEFTRGVPKVDEMQDVEAIVERLRPRPAHRPDIPAFIRRWTTMPAVPKWAFAATIVLAVAAGTLHLRRVWQPMIHPGEAGVPRSSSVRILEPSGDVAESPKEFRWEPAPGAARYEIVIGEVDGSELVRVPATGTTAAAPAEVASAPPLKTLTWKVIALGADGKPVGESPVTRFRVIAPEP